MRSPLGRSTLIISAVALCAALAACGSDTSATAEFPTLDAIPPATSVDEPTSPASPSADPSPIEAEPAAVSAAPKVVPKATPKTTPKPVAAKPSPAKTTAKPTTKPATKPAVKPSAVAPSAKVSVAASQPATEEPAHAGLPQGMDEATAVAAGLGSDGNPVVTVTGKDSTCTADTSSVAAGTVWFKMDNRGSAVNELYLMDSNGGLLIEVEYVDPGEAGAFKWTVDPGSYFVACAPGMTPERIQTPLTVR